MYDVVSFKNGDTAICQEKDKNEMEILLKILNVRYELSICDAH